MPGVDLVGARTVPQLLLERASGDDRAGLVFELRDGRVQAFPYAEVADRAARTAAGLAALGVGPGDKVLVHLPNRPELVFTFLGLAWLGAVGVPSNTANRAAELTHIAGWSDAQLVVTTDEHVALLEEVRQAVPAMREVIVAGKAGGHRSFDELLASPPAPPADVEPEAPLEIIFTSGTTSLPKGVVLTHANWLWSGVRSSFSVRVDHRDRLLTALPLFHVNAQSFTLLSAMTVGATAIFVEHYSAGRFMDQVREHGATHTSLVAMLVRTLLAQPPSAEDRAHALRRITYAINVTTPEKEAFEERFGVYLLNGYGLSEAMTEVSICPVYGQQRWPSIGLPALDRQVRIVDPAGAELPPGELGEITVRGIPGRTIMKEYYKDPAATARTIVDGWLHTGDNGYLDPDGYLYFVDRSKDMIKRAGENVSASEVEPTLVGHPQIAQAAVIGVPDPVRDEAVMAFIVAEPDAALSEDDVAAHCRQRLAAFKVPTIIVFRDELPVTSIGKVEKRRLRELARQEAAR